MTANQVPDNVLFELYERYFGEPEDESDVYFGFGMFFAGIAGAVIGLLLFLIGAFVYGLRTPNYAAIAQPGYVLGMLSLPVILLAVVVLLPTERRVIWTAIAGFIVTVLAAIGFITVYPDQWFDFNTGNTLLIVGTYAVGLAAVIASTGAALVAHQLERIQPPIPSDITAAEDEVTETVTDEDVRNDIEAAMADVELNWGGVELEAHRQLEFTSDYADEDTAMFDIEATRTVSDSGVEAQVSSLNALKGGRQNTAKSTQTVDEETSALTRLRQQKQRDEIPSDAPVTEGGILGKLLNKLRYR